MTSYSRSDAIASQAGTSLQPHGWVSHGAPYSGDVAISARRTVAIRPECVDVQRRWSAYVSESAPQSRFESPQPGGPHWFQSPFPA